MDDGVVVTATGDDQTTKPVQLVNKMAKKVFTLGSSVQVAQGQELLKTKMF